jgi:hypothetical protein
MKTIWLIVFLYHGNVVAPYTRDADGNTTIYASEQACAKDLASPFYASHPLRLAMGCREWSAR